MCPFEIDKPRYGRVVRHGICPFGTGVSDDVIAEVVGDSLDLQLKNGCGGVHSGQVPSGKKSRFLRDLPEVAECCLEQSIVLIEGLDGIVFQLDSVWKIHVY